MIVLKVISVSQLADPSHNQIERLANHFLYKHDGKIKLISLAISADRRYADILYETKKGPVDDDE
jgi:hypothetical protein